MPLGSTPLPRAAAPKRPGAAFARVLEIVAGVHPQMCDMAKRHAMNQIHAATTVRIRRLYRSVLHSGVARWVGGAPGACVLYVIWCCGLTLGVRAGGSRVLVRFPRNGSHDPSADETAAP